MEEVGRAGEGGWEEQGEGPITFVHDSAIHLSLIMAINDDDHVPLKPVLSHTLNHEENPLPGHGA